MKVLNVFAVVHVLVGLSLCSSQHAFGGGCENVKAVEIPEDCLLGTSDIVESKKTNSDSYLEAYIQGVLDSKYPDSGVQVSVRNGDVLLFHLPADVRQSTMIVDFVRDLTKRSVYSSNAVPKPCGADESHSWHGMWLPQSTVLFPTQIANPRQVSFSVGGRFHDKVGGPFASDVSIGDQFPIYRWANVRGGDLQLEVEACAFAVFNLRDQQFPLINTDYYAGIPVTYARGPWSYRLRLYHVSSHVGDEYLENHRRFHRKNKSFEAVDVSADYQFGQHLRFYGILGSMVHSDPEMHIKPLYVEYGFEARGPRTDFTQLFGQPFLSVHMQNWEDVGFAQDTTYALGYEWGKIHGFGRKVRAFFEYHQGFSPEGQFSRRRTKYFGLRLAYGF